MVWKIDNPQCNESKKIVWEVAQYLRGRGLDIGAGDFRVLPHVITVDNMNHAQFGFVQKPDVVAEASDLSMFASQSMDFVYSSHTLEHIVDTDAALKEWWRVLKPNGFLVLYLPHKNLYPNIGEVGSNPDHKHDFLPEDVVAKLPNGHDVVRLEDRNEGIEYSFLLVVKKIQGKERLESYKKPRPEKTACVVRYGAYGDLMQASSVWAGLKSQGYHVTVFSSLPGADAVLHDPNIDDLVLFDRDQVPNANLVDFWGVQKKKFDKWVNLSESVEGTLLALPGRTVHGYSTFLRHQLMNRNYVEMQHAIADVPYSKELFASKFYPTLEEKSWALAERKRIGGDWLIMWSLAGSSPHKTWQGLDNILASLMLQYPTCRVVLVGGPEAVILEGGWENENRIKKTCGKWNIRQTLSLLPHCDLVIGPETGVLNAAACLPNKKIVFLSHSSEENLTRDWTNTQSLAPQGTSCYPCHQLHYGWEHCHQNKDTGTAQCQVDISVERVWNAVEIALGA